MSYSFGVEKGFVARPPATAQLMVDSADRPSPTTSSPFDFQITRTQSILNGFFTRVSATEVVLEWSGINVGGELILDVSGASSRQNVEINVVGNYTMAGLLDTLVETYNSFTQGSTPNTTRPVGTTLNVGYNIGGVSLDLSGGKFQVVSSPLAIQMGIQIGLGLSPYQPINEIPDLRPYRYIDFVCNQLTYPQQLKDASTQPITRDILCRWYFAEDSPENLDKYGFPILQGYTPFVRRRIFNPPKYIKWDNNLPVGNLSFQVYDPTGNIVESASAQETNYLMTLQLQES